MRTTPKATAIVVATALILGLVGLTGCASSPSVPEATKATTPTKPASAKGVTASTTNAPEPGSVAVAGFEPARVATAAPFAEKFALAAMAGCSPDSLPVLQSLMTPALYRAAISAKPIILTFKPPTVMSPGCVTSQKLSDRQISAGEVVNGIPSVRVAVTVTEGLKLSTTTSPKMLEQITATRRYTVDVLPSGTDWLAHRVSTGNTTVASGK